MFNIEKFAEDSGFTILPGSLFEAGNHKSEKPRLYSKGIIDCPIERLEESLVYLKNHMGFAFLLGISCDDQEQNFPEKNFPEQNFSNTRVTYWLESIENHCHLGVCVSLKDGELLASAKSVFQNAEGYEALLKNNGKSILRSHPPTLNERVFDPGKTMSVEASYVDEQTYEDLWLKGPLNPLGERRVQLATLDNRVQKCQMDPPTGKVGETRLFVGKSAHESGKRLLDLGGNEGYFWSLLFFKTLEEKNAIALPDKAKAIRMLFMEFSRISCHLEFLANISFEMNANSYYFRFLEAYSEIEQLQRLYAGEWNSIGALTYGGVLREPPSNWVSLCLNELARFKRKVKDWMEQISSSLLWRQSTGMGELAPKKLLDWGISGTALRGSGVNFDLRKSSSLYLYDELDFQVPVGVNGSLFDRILVRLEECMQSANIASQLLDGMPTGPVLAEELLKIKCLSNSSEKPGSDEEQESYRNFILKGAALKDGEYFGSIEAPSGIKNINFRIENSVLVSGIYMSENTSGLVNCLEELALGERFEDLPLILKSLY